MRQEVSHSQVETASDAKRADPEKELWNAVILQACKDAVFDGFVNSERERARTVARAWLLGGSPDFREVCALAGMNAASVGEFAKNMAAAGWPKLNHLDSHAIH